MLLDLLLLVEGVKILLTKFPTPVVAGCGLKVRTGTEEGVVVFVAGALVLLVEHCKIQIISPWSAVITYRARFVYVVERGVVTIIIR